MFRPSRIITLKVSPEKLQAILDRPPAGPANYRCTPSVFFNEDNTTHPTAASSGAPYQGNSAGSLCWTLLSSAPPSPSPSPALEASGGSSPTTSRATHRVNTAPTTSFFGDYSEDEGEDDDLDEGTEMAEKDIQNKPAAAAAAAAGAASAGGDGGTPFYEAQRKHLASLLERKRKLAESLATREETIERKEAEYLESTPAGNILTGFDNYTKGSTQAAAAQRRRGGHPDQHRVFSHSSITYNPLAAVAAAAAAAAAATAAEGAGGSGGSGGSGANTPGSSHAPTPVSSTFGGGGGAQRDRKKKSVVVDMGDSESDAREVKKARTNFGTGRK